MIRVSDHALLRFLERVGGMDVEGLREQLEASFERASSAAQTLGVTNYAITVDGHTYLVRGAVVATVLSAGLDSRSHYHSLDPAKA